jgi:circadian clock protein KaiC
MPAPLVKVPLKAVLEPSAPTEAFGWSMTGWEILDAMSTPDLVAIGDFDLAGTLAILSGKVHAMKARRVVFDYIDVLFQLLPGVQERRRELNRLHSWLLDEELTAIITVKLDWVETDKPAPLEDAAMRYLLYIVDCVVAFANQYDNGFSQRRVRVVKYRGSGFAENDTPFVISPSGLQVAVTDRPTKSLPLTGEKISTGILALDEMLYGGFYAEPPR